MLSKMQAGYVIGIGAQKCASSWVHANLAPHPEICPAAEKEVDFFSYHHDRGHDWYARQFRGSGVRFENSPSYLHDPRAPARLAAFAPDARIILTLRDPVERAYSHHLHEIVKGHIPAQPFEQALARNPDYLEQGFYARHLSRWLDAFAAEQILVLLAEDISRDPPRARRQLLAFLGLEAECVSALSAERRNVSDRARVPLLRHTLRAVGTGFRRAGMEEALLRIKRLGPVAQILDWNSQPVRSAIPAMEAGTRQRLADFFAEDMRDLAGILGRETLPWATWEEVEAPMPDGLAVPA